MTKIVQMSIVNSMYLDFCCFYKKHAFCGVSQSRVFILVSCPVLGVCAVNGLLYVVGGDDGSCNLSTVEYYNPTTDKWTVVSSCMSTGRSYAGKAYRYF